MPEVLLAPSEKSPRYWIAVVAIGAEHMAEWLRVAAPGIKRYAEKFGVGLVVFGDNLDKSDQPKHPSWQKLLLGKEFSKVDPGAEGVLVLDTDILANHCTGANFFEGWNPAKIGMVSKRFRMPYSYEDVATRIVFLRNRFVDSNYPLDSIWLFTLEELYRQEGLEPVADECCAGLFAFSPAIHSKFLAGVYEMYRHRGESLALEQVQLNFHVQTEGMLQVLDYHFHTLWVYEMASKYPFLYREDYRDNVDLISDCVGASLLNSTFLHFAGSWNESAMIGSGTRFLENGWGGAVESYASYRSSNPSGTARGRVLPTTTKRSRIHS